MKIEIKKILCPVDFSESSEHALRYAVAFTEAYGAELTLLHVIELPYLPSYSTAGVPDLNLPVERMQEQSRAQLRELFERHQPEAGRIDGHSTVGNPFLEIIRHARDGEFDLIVMGTHGRTGLQHVLIGSVAEKVVRKAPCPVLTVKHPEHEFVMP
jgi:nucleotide-binding universal stress UspA family protein